MTKWPRESEVDVFYGNPRGKGGSGASLAWEKSKLVYIEKLPFKMHMGDTPITKIRCHRLCADPFRFWLEQVWKNAGYDPRVIAQWGMDVFSGGYNYRPKRGMNSLSMHAYGIAMDFDAPRNGLHDRTPNFANLREQIVKPFLELGGVWGGDWNGNGKSLDERRCDGMHFQFAK